MPFTFSHPALILPLKLISKKYLSLTGLIIGSLVPDFEYFLRMKIESKYSHDILGVLWFDLPLALILSFVYHNIVKDDFIDNSPRFIKNRLQSTISLNWNKYLFKNYLIVIISIIIGAYSHLLWDSFTHPTGYFVTIFPLLQENINFNIYSIPLFKILQHLSTFFGGVICLVAFFYMKKSEISNNRVNYKYWLVLSFLFILIFSMKFLHSLTIKQYGNIIVSAISAFILSIILVSFLFKKK